MSCYLIFGNLRNRVWSDAYDLLRIPGGRTHVAYINKDIKISKEDMLDKGVTPK